MQSGKTLKLFILLVISIVILSESCGVSSDSKTAKAENDKWEKTIQSFEDWDSKNSFPLDGILFVGSSSIRLWPTRERFPEFPVINRGFGGSHISNVNYFAHRIVLPYKPRMIVFYAGDNDISGGKTPQRVFGDYRKFVNLVHKELPATRIIFVDIKPSLSRWSLWPLMNEANSMIKKFSDKDERLFVFDSATPLLGSDGKPDEQFFLKDNLHLNSKGYDAWTRAIKPIVKEAFKPELTEPLALHSKESEGKRTYLDVEYVPGGHERQKLDIYLPEHGTDTGPLPVVVWIHGGAWRAGNKKNCRSKVFLKDGYAAASINYRLSQHATFPAQIEDCKAAIRYLRANAKKYNIDPDRIGVWGSSAGGHLVALLGTTSDIQGFDKGPNLHVSSRVQAVCDFFGPTDFTKMSNFESRMDHDAADSPESILVGGPVQENKEACKRANPITYVSRNDPPILIVHGDKDPLVPHNQSELLYEALKKAEVDVKFHTVKGGGHGFKDVQVDRMVKEFFNRHLKK
ncbi:MAG: alpha/beta hydrolase fold domain-containing protein [Sedimentisphaerales bacterium]|nr:alpha/beta hydrolase fold domain-containing protein [Sedimentisphaerales bacterium]